MILVMILILLHIVVCIVVTFHRKHVATVRRENVMPLVYAVPFFGAVCYGVRLYEDRRHRLGGRDTDMKPKDIMKADIRESRLRRMNRSRWFRWRKHCW